GISGSDFRRKSPNGRRPPSSRKLNCRSRPRLRSGPSGAVIDLHTHVLPGLDDGAVDLADSVAICRAAADDGVQILAATPHVREDYPTTAEQMRAGLEEVRAAVEGVVAVVPGGEVALHELERPLDELRAFGLAGNLGYLLVETPYLEWPRSAAEQLLQLRRDGIVP